MKGSKNFEKNFRLKMMIVLTIYYVVNKEASISLLLII